MTGIFYKPENAFMGDIIPFYDDGEFKPFYLKKWRDAAGGIHREGWHMLTSADNIHFTEHCCHIAGATGSVIRAGDVYHLFFTRFEKQYNPVKQWVCHAISKDHMATWSELPEEAFEADGEIYSITDFRDPFVFRNDAEKNYWMLVAARDKRARTKRNGCVGLLKSEDLAHWRFCEPFYSPETNPSALECPDLFEMNGWYYLIYSCYTDRFQTVYRRSRSLDGPWTAPEVDSFDARAFYAAKTCTDGKKRYLYGWNATRRDNLWGFDPAADFGDDYRTWDWGGSMIVHELRQEADGTLVCGPLETAEDLLREAVPISAEALSGNWGEDFSVDTPCGFSAMLLNPVPELGRWSCDIDYSGEIREFGIALEVDEEFDTGYYLSFQPARNRVEWKSGIRFFEDGGKLFPYAVEMERPVRLAGSRTIHIDLFVQGTILVVYVDRKVALSARMFNYIGRNFGLFASDGAAVFRNIEMRTVKGTRSPEPNEG